MKMNVKQVRVSLMKRNEMRYIKKAYYIVYLMNRRYVTMCYCLQLFPLGTLAISGWLPIRPFVTKASCS